MSKFWNIVEDPSYDEDGVITDDLDYDLEEDDWATAGIDVPEDEL
jgi:hypothetical protein